MSHPTDYDTLIGRLLFSFRDSFSEGMVVDADHALRFAMRDVCAHIAAEIIALDELKRGITIREACQLLTDAAEGRR